MVRKVLVYGRGFDSAAGSDDGFLLEGLVDALRVFVAPDNAGGVKG